MREYGEGKVFRRIRTAVAGSALALSANFGAEAAPAVDFDRGFDVKSVIGELRVMAAEEPRVPQVRAERSSERVTRGCALVTFKAEDAAVSQPVGLESHVFQTVCTQYGEQRVCEEKLIRTERRQVAIKLSGTRATLPWEADVFQACLQNRELDAKSLRASHDYGDFLFQIGPENGLVTVPLKNKKRTPPDPSGITQGGFSQAGGELKLTLNDKWSQHYKQGEKTIIEIALKREVPHWLDDKVLKLDLVQKPAASYEISLSLLAKLEGKVLVAGQKYYVQWRFKREGKVSDDAWQAGGETARVAL